MIKHRPMIIRITDPKNALPTEADKKTSRKPR
jgi:hypothetical protein